MTYLDRHLEPAETITFAQSRMAELTMGEWRHYEVTYADGVASAELIIEDNRIRYTYKQIDDLPATSRESGLIEAIREDPHQYRELLTAEIENDQSGAVLDLIDELPEGWRVFIDTYGDANDECFLEEKAIRISRNLGSSEQFYILAHEIGHAHGDKAHPHLSKDGLIESNSQYHARLLECERDAHAYALGRLRPFLVDDPNQAFSRQAIGECLVHSISLGSYSQFIRHEQSQPLRSFAKRMGRTAIMYVEAFVPKRR